MPNYFEDPEAGLVIDDCGHPGRVSHQELSKILEVDFAEKFSEDEFGGSENEKTAIYKYDLS
jgi:hypothetical protein